MKISCPEVFSLEQNCYICNGSKQNTMETLNPYGFKNFNRHEVFGAEELNICNMIIAEHDENAIHHGGNLFSEFKNMMCGLYDGYLYNGLLHHAAVEGISKANTQKLEGLIDRIEAFIANGETQTTH